MEPGLEGFPALAPGLFVGVGDVNVADESQLGNGDVAVQTVRHTLSVPDLLVQVVVFLRGGVVGEDVTGVEAVLRHPRHRFQVVAGVPERGIGLLEGLYPQLDVLVVVVLAVVIEKAGGEAVGEQVHLLVEHFPADVQVNVELLGLHRRDAPAYAQVKAAVAEVIQHTDFVVQADGIVEGQQEHQRPQPQPGGALRRRSQEHRRRRRYAERRYVVLRQVVAVKPGAVGVFQHLQPVLEDVMGRRLVPLNPVEKPELQGIVERVGLRHGLPPTPRSCLRDSGIISCLRPTGRRPKVRQPQTDGHKCRGGFQTRPYTIGRV